MTIHDLRGVTGDPVFDADLCIVGAGPAGLSIALQFLNTPVRVCVVESGGLERSDPIEELNEIESVGLRRAPQDVTRSRGLGGTSAIWSGRCGVFDRFDFHEREWLPFSGWPIDLDDIAPYLDRAGVMLGLGPAMYGDENADLYRRAEYAPSWQGRDLTPVVYQFSKGADSGAVRDFAQEGIDGAEHIGALQHAGAPAPRHLGESFRAVLGRSTNVDVLLHANVTEITTDESGSTVRGVAVNTLDGRKSQVRAGRVVLACGGLDNARLLLHSTTADPRGVGNAYGMVGRFLADHPFALIATYQGRGSEDFRRLLGARWLDRHGSRHVYSIGLRLDPEVQRREELLNCALHLVEFGDEPAPIARIGQALRGLRNRDLASASADVLRAVQQPVQLALGARDRYLLHRPTLATPTRVEFGCVVEQKLDPESRVTLADELDAIGMRRAKVDWRASDLEFQTAKRMTGVVLAAMAQAGYELPVVSPWLSEGPDAFRASIHDMAHPMCTTRMSDDPAHGVVDANCKVHGVEGLYVAGGSVFSTPGYMNPTLMIVSLAIRLADHLRSNLPTPKVDVSARMDQPVAKDQGMPTPRRVRVGFVGAGQRVRSFYLPVIAAMPDEFEVVGFTTRTPTSAQAVERDCGVPAFTDAAAMVAATEPDFLVVAVSSDAIDTTLPPLIDLGVPLLLETPFAWNIRVGRRTLQAIAQRELLVGVAEQTPFLPTEQIKRKLIELGALGCLSAAESNFATYAYHGIAMLRAYVRPDEPIANVKGQTHAPHSDSAPAAVGSWLQGTITYDNQTTLIHRSGDEGLDAPDFAPHGIRLHGSFASLVDDRLTFEDDDRREITHRIERHMHSGRLQALTLHTAVGEVRWDNPFARADLDDEQIAVATLLMGMKRAVLYDGIPLYSAARAFEDVEIMRAVRLSADQSGVAVRLPLRRSPAEMRAFAQRAARVVRERARRRAS